MRCAGRSADERRWSRSLVLTGRRTDRGPACAGECRPGQDTVCCVCRTAPPCRVWSKTMQQPRCACLGMQSKERSSAAALWTQWGPWCFPETLRASIRQPLPKSRSVFLSGQSPPPPEPTPPPPLHVRLGRLRSPLDVNPQPIDLPRLRRNHVEVNILVPKLFPRRRYLPECCKNETPDRLVVFLFREFNL